MSPMKSVIEKPERGMVAMTDRESRLLNVGARVIWNGGSNDAGTVERDWAGVVIKWDNR